MTQSLGSGSISCNVDAEAIEQLAVSLENELNDNVDLVVINRFGKRESAGAGFCCVIARAMELGIPVLTVVKQNWLDTWLDYGGEWVMTLPTDRACILEWYRNVSAPCTPAICP
jgi:nucleoside-triphosphatase THEP1